MISRVLLGAVLVLLLTSAGLGGAVWYQNRSNAVLVAEKQRLHDELKALQKLRKRDAATLARRAQKNAASARETALLRQQLAAALAANQSWGSTPVPPEVQNALKHHE